MKILEKILPLLLRKGVVFKSSKMSFDVPFTWQDEPLNISVTMENVVIEIEGVKHGSN